MPHQSPFHSTHLLGGTKTCGQLSVEPKISQSRMPWLWARSMSALGTGAPPQECST